MALEPLEAVIRVDSGAVGELCRRLREETGAVIVVVGSVDHRRSAEPAFELRLEGREVWVGDQRIDLTVKEFELLAQLASCPGQAFSRDALLQSVWGPEFVGSGRLVDAHVWRLRQKLGDQGHRVATVRGFGYKLKG